MSGSTGDYWRIEIEIEIDFDEDGFDFYTEDMSLLDADFDEWLKQMEGFAEEEDDDDDEGREQFEDDD